LHFIAFVAASTNPLFAAVCVLRSFAILADARDDDDEAEEEEKWPSDVIFYFFCWQRNRDTERRWKLSE
jgi:hypothetical protein